MLYLNNHYGNISNIFSDFLEFASKKIILRRKIREAFGYLAYNP